ncbi:MAG: flagellar export protein FliJ [Lachnospiraceae bacterium]|nr:flagellar export protein FliJ [Lachnospiraceae bacterium]
MARFRFRLQNILEIKIKMETQAKQEFSAAAEALAEEERKLDVLVLKKHTLEEEASRLLTGMLDFRDIDDNALARMQTDEKIGLQKEAIKRAEKELDKAREKMAEAVMERKTYEKLREKAFEEFVAGENKAEGKVIDELTSYRFGQKINNSN